MAAQLFFAQPRAPLLRHRLQHAVLQDQDTRDALLAKTLYRASDVYQVSTELRGGVAQVQKTVHKAQRLISDELTRLYQDDGTPTGTELSTTKPRQVLVIGSLSEFNQGGAANPEKLSSFELYRSSVQGIEVITFDELCDRACFTVEDR